MSKSNEITTLQVITVLVAAYPRTEVPRETVNVYVSMLDDIPPGELAEGVKLHISRSKWFPTVAEIRESVGELRSEKMSGGALLASLAWNSVIDQIVTVGYTGTPVFEDKLAAAAVNAIGWRNLCFGTNVAVDRAHFLKIYNELRDFVVEDETRLPDHRRSETISGLLTERSGPVTLTRLLNAGTGEVEVLE